MELIETYDVEEDDPTWALAITESSKSPLRFKLGAAIIKRGKLLGFGYNSYKTHPKFGSKDGFKTLHAEGAALYSAKKLGNDVRGATMIIYRRGARNSKPCEDCQKLIEEAGISKVIYTNYE